MNEIGLLAPQIPVLTLLLIADLAALTFESLRFPYSVGLVILGFGLGDRR